MIQKIKTVCQNTETLVKVNGHLLQAFLVKRGLRQGDPLSMMLYIISTKIFLEKIRQSSGIKNIAMGGNELKTSAFADDTTIYIGKKSSLAHLEMQLMHFEKTTDIKFSKTKCMRIWLGSNKRNPKKLLRFKWNSDTIKILGYTYGHNTI